MRIAVAGGTGLVGSHAVEEALARGHRVRALVRPTSDTTWLDRWGVEKVVGDLEDGEALRRGVEICRPELHRSEVGDRVLTR